MRRSPCYWALFILRWWAHCASNGVAGARGLLLDESSCPSAYWVLLPRWVSSSLHNLSPCLWVHTHTSFLGFCLRPFTMAPSKPPSKHFICSPLPRSICMFLTQPLYPPYKYLLFKVLPTRRISTYPIFQDYSRRGCFMVTVPFRLIANQWADPSMNLASTLFSQSAGEATGVSWDRGLLPPLYNDCCCAHSTLQLSGSKNTRLIFGTYSNIAIDIP